MVAVNETSLGEREAGASGIAGCLLGASGSIGSGGDQYVGLDRFGRVVDQNWVNAAGTTVDGYTYSYDGDSNVTARNNTLDSAYSQGFTYDPLNRLTAATQGGSAYQSWNLDSQGNWSSFTNGTTTQTETANAQNQITSISGSATPTYDANGNMISDQNGNTYVYDAWNRLVEVKNAAGTVIAQYSYDARGYRITESYPQGGNGVAAGTTNYIYYDANWQAIETRTNGTAASNVTSQMVWSAAYINAAVLQDSYSGGTIQPNSRLYFTQDANWDTTAVIGYDSTTQTWGVVQRYVYSPYGNITVLNADWSTPPAGTQPLVNNLYQGMTLDAVTGLYYERNRDYSPTLGRWMEQDPAQFINGANTYQFVDSSPVGNVDAGGLHSFLYQFFHPPAYVVRQQLVRVAVETEEGGPEPIRVWNDAGALPMWDQFITGEGRSIVIVGKPFLRAVESSWELKQEESQYRAQLLEKVKAAAKKLKPGQSTTVRLDVKDFTYTMPGSKINPFGRYLGFGEIHVNIDGSANVRETDCGGVKYNGVIHFGGFDRYQWGTLENAWGHWYDPLPDAVGRVLSKVGTPFNSYWNWTEPLYGDLP